MTPFRLVLLAIACLLLLGGPPLAAEEDDAQAGTETLVVADFEGEEAEEQFRASDSEASLVSDGDGGQAVRWTQAASSDGGWLTIRGIPDDLRPFRRLVFRVRSLGPLDESLSIRFRESDAYMGTKLESVTESWQTVSLLLPLMYAEEEFQAQGKSWLRFVCWETKGFQVEVDDVRLVKEGAGWRYSLEDLQAQGRDLAGLTFRVADAENEEVPFEVRAESSTWERQAIKGRGKGHCLTWKVAPTGDTVWLSLLAVPQDIRPYRTLRLRARIEEKRLEDKIHVRLRADGGSIGAPMPPLKRKWQEVELPLPLMTKQKEIDPERVYVLRFVAWSPKGFTLHVDDVRFVKGPGGWRMSEKEHLAHLFGEKRVKKVKRIETDHFEVFTDSAAARRKLPKALEKTYAFVIASLGLEEMEDRLPVYIFQSSRHYHEFCERKGWSREAAEASAGHAWRDYFATYYQAAETPTVTHELTHSIFHRARGTGGGSWFQEGVAVYVEELWQKRSVATLFATRMRSGKYLPLRDFVSSRKLIAEHDVRGGAGTSESLYLQAGAFFEFLLRGPLAETRPEAIRELALLDERDPDARVAALEEILGAPLAEIQEAWLAWGSKPPEHESR